MDVVRTRTKLDYQNVLYLIEPREERWLYCCKWLLIYELKHHAGSYFQELYGNVYTAIYTHPRTER